MTTLSITGMSCQNCVRHVGEALRAVPGVRHVEVDLASERAVIDGSAPLEALLAALEAEDYTGTPLA